MAKILAPAERNPARGAIADRPSLPLPRPTPLDRSQLRSLPSCVPCHIPDHHNQALSGGGQNPCGYTRTLTTTAKKPCANPSLEVDPNKKYIIEGTY